MRGPRQPPPELDAGRVRPVQVVDDQHHGPRGGLVDGERDELLGEQRGHVGAAVGGDLAAQQPGDRGPPGVHRRGPHLERVEERQQRELLAELVPGTPEDLIGLPLTQARPLGLLKPAGSGRERGAKKGGLAYSRLALDEHSVATALGEVSQ